MNSSIDNLSNKAGNLKRLPNEFYYDLLKFDDYSFFKKEKRIYIKIDTDFQIENNIENVKCNSLNILYELLKLRKKLEIIYTDFYNNYILFDKLFSEIDIDKFAKDILAWCVKQGYPYVNEALNDKETKTHKLFENNKKTYSFLIMDFLASLNDIYSLYLIYLVIVGKEKTISQNTYISYNDTPIDARDLKNISNLSIQEYETIFEKKYNSINLKSIVTFDEHNYPYITTKANNLFEAAAYQIALMIYNPEDDIRICPICKNVFNPRNSRQKYCEQKTCYPQLAYKRKKSAEKKRQKNKPAN